MLICTAPAYASSVINGHRAENVKVSKSGGYGHADFTFETAGIPMYREDEIESIFFSVGNTEGMESYDILLREN